MADLEPVDPNEVPNPGVDYTDLSPEAQGRIRATIKSYEEEFNLNEDKDIAKKAEEILRNDVLEIAAKMAHDAIHCPDPRIRHQAQKYILDNVVFLTGNRTSGRDEFAKLLEKISKEAPTEATS